MSAKLMVIYAQSDLDVPSDLLYSIHSYLWVADSPTALVFLRSCVVLAPCFPLQNGIQISWGGCLATASDDPGIILPAF